MNYKETIKYLYESVPMFQKVGGSAYKEGLSNTIELDNHFGNPHRSFRTIHVGGTNGKGSCSHTLAAILQSAGYRVGLYTSPHLVDFRERIRVNGEMVSEEYVVNFVKDNRQLFDSLSLSFFELTTALAFRYFADAKVDVAVIEVGLGGRLDCTNIITPDLAVITNISFDHVQFLGDTLAKIASEKAGIIKSGIPVVIGEVLPETREVFVSTATEKGAPITLAEENQQIESYQFTDGHLIYQTKSFGELRGELGGYCQTKNTNTILNAVFQLQKAGYNITDKNVHEGFANVCELTGLMGRWQKVGDKPLMVCDTGHNIGGMEYITKQLAAVKCRTMRIVIGMVSDKDVSGVLSLLPKDAVYYFTRASIPRALAEDAMKAKAEAEGLHGECYPTVAEAVTAAKKESLPEDFIFVGGSSFIVADLLASRDALNLY
jgi:dihydrofolate synthase/folylpolyglutamate synthase